MFTGLIEEVGQVKAVDKTNDGVVIAVECSRMSEISLGDSIAINGVCLTATAIEPDAFLTDVMNETLVRTTTGNLTVGNKVNLELAMQVGDRLGGHIVQGHVDGVVELAGIEQDGFSRVLTLSVDQQLEKYVVEKGSVTLDGVSLTVVNAGHGRLSVSLIPETLERTVLSDRKLGDQINLEVDILAKYVERQTAAYLGKVA